MSDQIILFRMRNFFPKDYKGRWPFTDNLLSLNALLNVETDDHHTILNPLVVHTNIMRYSAILI